MIQDPRVAELLAQLVPGDEVEVVLESGTRLVGAVQAPRPEVDQPGELPIRRAGGTTTWVKHALIRELARV